MRLKETIEIYEENLKEDDDDDQKEIKDLVTLKSLNFEIKQGEFVCIIGDVGSGKSSVI